MSIAKILREKVEKKGIMPENQTGFKKEKGVMDNVHIYVYHQCIYILNYLVQKWIVKPKGVLVSLFVNLKVTFYSVDRKIRELRKRGVREGLIERIEKTRIS